MMIGRSQRMLGRSKRKGCRSLLGVGSTPKHWVVGTSGLRQLTSSVRFPQDSRFHLITDGFHLIIDSRGVKHTLSDSTNHHLERMKLRMGAIKTNGLDEISQGTRFVFLVEINNAIGKCVESTAHGQLAQKSFFQLPHRDYYISFHNSLQVLRRHRSGREFVINNTNSSNEGRGCRHQTCCLSSTFCEAEISSMQLELSLLRRLHLYRDIRTKILALSAAGSGRYRCRPWWRLPPVAGRTTYDTCKFCSMPALLLPSFAPRSISPFP
mmetsp:Transcript_25460/g.73637  ORF Transcript_25460/g.73637 Transcript_25460/m.73637 type:complete len:267 (+) Transcript_25460:1771-2571(+)